MNSLHIIEIFIVLIHGFGFLMAIDALYLTRSSQSAIAWGLTLITFPYMTLPLYLVFGRRRFKGYRRIHQQLSRNSSNGMTRYHELLQKNRALAVSLEAPSEKLYEQIAGEEFTEGSEVNLLIDGAATFKEIFAAIESAQHFVLVQFFIVRADKIGRELQRRLIERAKAGVRVCLLYDEIGSRSLPQEYLAELLAVGVESSPFATRQGPGNFFQFNFRNHRKLVVVDGNIAFVGGINVGDEYLGEEQSLPKWRDTHLKIEGPAVLPLQKVFITDWLWATGKDAPKIMPPQSRAANHRVLPIPTGPADEIERCTLLFLQAVNSARSRLWLATPYFVPSDALQHALQLAVLRGVDVRILLPSKPDQYLVWYAAYYYLPDLVRVGVRVFRYSPGFMHQKVMLIDDTLAVIGTANLDQRSFTLNFELSVLIADRGVCDKTAEMLSQDFNLSTEETTSDFEQYPLSRRLMSKFARLFSPVL